MVKVQVTVDESGKVSYAEALDGHPLLRQAAEAAAYRARFAPTRLSGQPVEVSGVLSYYFVLP
jgi:outer membrane biosynthesis protein TonB